MAAFENFGKRDLNSSKAYSRNIINIRMLKICHEPIWKLLEIVFWSYLEKGKFAFEWKKG